MKKLVLVLFAFVSCLSLYAQQTLKEQGPTVSPEVHTDGSVTFRLLAPDANKVFITGDFLPNDKVVTPNGEVEVPGKAALAKNAAGVWEYTTNTLKPELYMYSFMVDGLRMMDPGNVYMIRDVSTVTNVFLVAGGRDELYAVHEIPHGTVARRWYESPSLQMKRQMTIYTPPGYEESKSNYPVLYLLHGMGGDEEAWIALGRTAQILDNLIALGKAKPMIVVMPNGNVSQEAAPGESSLGWITPTMQLPKTMEGSMETSFPDIVRFVDANYRTITQKSGRAIAGLSMGGYHSLHISKEYPDLFDYIGLFSAAIFPRPNVQSPIYKQFDEKLKVQFDKQPKLYWIAIGKTDFLYKDNLAYRNKLDEHGYKYVYFENEGGHIWRNWRIYLSEFVPMLFNRN